jgi:hypothetical protein
MTHSFDENQRSVQLRVKSVRSRDGGYTTTLVGPDGPRTAPPGDYMLFVLDANRVPSVARIVRLG